MTGFNQIVNTPRAREMLAILSRAGTFLPLCLTFGPQNGPEDFALVVDRVYAPGRNRKLRFMKEWLPYVDDLTIRTGRVLDGVMYRDAEVAERIRDASKDANRPEKAAELQTIEEALGACGFGTTGLGSERKPRSVSRKYDPVQSDTNHPFAHVYVWHRAVCTLHAVFCLWLHIPVHSGLYDAQFPAEQETPSRCRLTNNSFDSLHVHVCHVYTCDSCNSFELCLSCLAVGLGQYTFTLFDAQVLNSMYVWPLQLKFSLVHCYNHTSHCCPVQQALPFYTGNRFRAGCWNSKPRCSRCRAAVFKLELHSWSPP